MDNPDIDELKLFFAGNEKVDARILKKIPEELISITIPSSTIILLDDLESVFSSNKQYAELLFDIASVHTHHRDLICFFVVQTTGILKKSHKLNTSFSQSTHVIFFRNTHDGKAFRRYMNNFSIKLKDNLSLYDCYEKYIQETQYAYLLLFISPKEKFNTAYSNIIMNTHGPMLSFHESGSEDE